MHSLHGSRNKTAHIHPSYFVILLPQLQCSSRCAWHSLARAFSNDLATCHLELTPCSFNRVPVVKMLQHAPRTQRYFFDTLCGPNAPHGECKIFLMNFRGILVDFPAGVPLYVLPLVGERLWHDQVHFHFIQPCRFKHLRSHHHDS